MHKTAMKLRYEALGIWENEQLLDALRRDVRFSLEKAWSDKTNTEFHLSNARRSIRLLEALNPKSTRREPSEKSTKNPEKSG